MSKCNKCEHYRVEGILCMNCKDHNNFQSSRDQLLKKIKKLENLVEIAKNIILDNKDNNRMPTIGEELFRVQYEKLNADN